MRVPFPRNDLHIAPELTALALITLFHPMPLRAQSTPNPWPFPSRSSGDTSLLKPPAPLSTPPPYDVPLRQERWEQLPNREISAAGQQALAIKPEQWRHGETENFIVHYRSISDALQIAREIEFDLWYVAQSLGAGKEQYARKSHVYVFQDEKEWQKFLQETHAPDWVHSFALRDDLFLDLRAAEAVSIRTLSRTRRRTRLWREFTGNGGGRFG